ncbi:MAG TPA: choice-of-anchor Q domain-containing protein [Polyangia bacterium]|nr:choice-of-anchor Q domain-containing protein [Polyangia bacterium]
MTSLRRPASLRSPSYASTIAIAIALASCHRTGRINATNDGARAPDPAAAASDPLVTSIAATPTPVEGAPYIAYTDLVAGPISGGENDKGAYLSLFGKNFGTTGAGSTVKVLINDVEVDNYRYLGASRGRPDIQQITVQVGSIGHPPAGRALPIKVVVKGVASNTNHTFTVQPGDFLFVSPTGNDANATKNDPKRPWRHVQTPTEGGALADVKAGDVIVLRGGPNVVWSDVGYDNRWLRFRRVTGNQPTGAKGHGYIAIVAYPGEDVHYVPPPGTSGGINGIGEDYPQFSDWIVISGLHIEGVAASMSDGAPVNLQANSDHWRVVNNELGPWPAAAGSGDKAGGIAGNGKSVAILGNHIHDIGGGKENHGVYLDSGSTDVEVAFNTIHDITGGNVIQTYDNLGGRPLDRIFVHHNALYRGGRYGLNISDGTHSYAAWNNVIYDIALAAVRFNTKSDATSSFVVVYNTIFDANRGTSATNAPIANDDKLDGGTVLISDNVIGGDGTSQASSYVADSSSARARRIDRNLWIGLGVAPSEELEPVYGANGTSDPRFVGADKRDFAPQAGSAVIDQAIATPFSVVDDYRLKARPSGAKPDVGAFEY